MAGTENSGPRAALRGLFQGRTAVICDREKCEPTGLEVVERMYRALGMRVVYMSAEEHDLHVAYVSHLSHISSFVLANTVLAKEKNVNTIFDLAGGGFESTVRLAKSSPEMWTPIFAQNLENVREAVQSYIEHLQEFQKSLAEKDFTKTSALMTGANEIRRVLSRMGEKTGESKKNV
jgi:prephenate dehydrogenase